MAIAAAAGAFILVACGLGLMVVGAVALFVAEVTGAMRWWR